ncbi:MAG: OmpA family protein [Cytophagaceae bacterium]|nr:OmpA family protein [Cytophagaceae bacterium]MBK9507991.1 OmpA family protein [Cytophagaceae bacterium]MBK9936395.1 OmpA family protein [Cytophagaceae bacterium]MBL0300144.1 OmpA family protein [Cytophagaceae bacterium]MBL0327081.1 OmpA family protein [Cytophagaceae bacterium]
MNLSKKLILLFSAGVVFTSCVSKKKFVGLQSELTATKADLERRGEMVNDFKNKLVSCEQEKEKMAAASKASQEAKESQMADLRAQIADLQKVRDTQMQQVGGLTVLNQSANENINRTLAQLEKKDKYITLLQAAKSKADSMNLALAVNLKSSLAEGLDDQDVEVKVDKTVVMVNLSDKMLFTSGSYKISPKAFGVLEKVAKMLQARPDLEMMVEGYTDNVAINTECLDDNWDLSVKRATAVVRTLQKKFGVDPNKLVAAGRGEYNALTSNDTAEGRSINRRTRIILMPKLDQFYDLLNPDNVK